MDTFLLLSQVASRVSALNGTVAGQFVNSYRQSVAFSSGVASSTINILKRQPNNSGTIAYRKYEADGKTPSTCSCDADWSCVDASNKSAGVFP